MAALAALPVVAGQWARPSMGWMVAVVVFGFALEGTTISAEGEEYSALNIIEITELSEFEEQVENIVNSSDSEGAASYYPVVQFHVSWCEHCKAALPELDKAAGQILDFVDDKRGFPVPPKFFSIQCDKASRDITRLCDKFVGTHFPMLIVFRQHRNYYFINRPRSQGVYTMWIKRMIRPFLLGVESVATVRKWPETSFVLKARPDESDAIEMWSMLAAKQVYLEEFSFVFIDAAAKGAKEIGAEVSMIAPPAAGLSPLSFIGDLDDDDAFSKLEAWVDTNRFPSIGNFASPLSFHNYQGSNRKVVILVHEGGESGSQARKVFESFVNSERPSCNYVFVVVDASQEKELRALEINFPLLVPAVSTYPKIFGMMGNTYFEDPKLDDVRDIRVDAIEALFADPEARQEKSWQGWAKEKKKIYTRFATRSVANTILAIVMPILVLAILHTIGKMLMESLSGADDDAEKHQKDGNGKANKKNKKA